MKRHPQPEWDLLLRPARAWLRLWTAVGLGVASVIVYLVIDALNDPLAVEAQNVWAAVGFMFALLLGSQAIIEATCIWTELGPDGLRVRRGIVVRIGKRTIPYRKVTRVRAHQRVEPFITVNVADGTSVKVANAMTEVIGGAPEVATEWRANRSTMMREIAKTIELRRDESASR